MFKTRLYVMRWVISLFVAAAMAGSANAAPPEHAGGGNKGNKPAAAKAHKGQKAHKATTKHSATSSSSINVDVFFDDRHRQIIRDYYGGQVKGGHCPPGLAKKNNGCLPPGQAKKWQVGHRLPGDVVYYDIPHDLSVRLGHDNPAYKLVRVGADILKIGVGTGMVIEAVEDLGGLF